ncbi:sensor histidine kinase [Saccharopolyspora erythraea]|uniref:Two-component system sensor kinase n=2 Tax=Saccharopolyspora erythraea TaxID=1836 RepID=A4FFW7_SACEN|nr:histidine kinase [Saccharopolyspora erythraea]QRK93129.1 two-component sensor histidine kinase [Saccharopolyspora erythraea]CAM02942.1 two-component system sensor kinase [Saccharopolyspora erythraea NRRL 2338]
MSDSPLVGARKFEAYVRWSTYSAVTFPVTTLLGAALMAGRSTGAHAAAPAAALGLVLALGLTAGNIVVVNWSIDTIVGRARRFPVGAVAVWALTLAAFVVVAPRIPLPAMGLAVAAAIASAAASFVPALDARRALLLNAAILVTVALFTGGSEVPTRVTGAIVISAVLWACWSSAWMLRVLRELQAAHEMRAELALANERLRISRDLHDVFGRTLATIAVKSSLASELVRRRHDERAAAEITAVRQLAEEAGTEVRHIVRGEPRTTWDGEVSGARSLLESAGIRCTVTGDPVPQECAEALAWVVREGVTNLLRHSAANQVTLATANQDGEVLLTIANDGARPEAPRRPARPAGPLPPTSAREWGCARCPSGSARSAGRSPRAATAPGSCSRPRSRLRRKSPYDPHPRRRRRTPHPQRHRRAARARGRLRGRRPGRVR